MRFLELNLIAFGHFTSQRIDLSAGNHGLHLIYGSNEAGKSSSLRAITDFLFEFPARTPDNFQHPYSQLRIGATLQHSDGTQLKAIRRKSPQKSLRGIDDETLIEEGVLASFLGDVDREFFGAMFGINHERLRMGGAEISRGKGRLGELLFAAGTGFAGLQSVQQELGSDIDRLLKPSGRSGQIHAGLQELHELKKQVLQSQISVETWKQHQEGLEQAEQRKLEIDDQLARSRAELERLTRIQDSLTAIGIWKYQRDKVLSMQNVPRLDVDFSSRATRLIAELRKAESQQLDASEILRNGQSQLDVSDVHDNFLDEAETIEHLRDRMGGYRRALSDRPAVLAKQELIETEIQELLRNVSPGQQVTDIDCLRIPADRKVRIAELGFRMERLMERLTNEKKSVQKLQRQISETEMLLNQLPPHRDLTPLKLRLQTVQEQGDLDGPREQLERECNNLQSQIDLGVRRLSLWQGTVEDLQQNPFPTHATVDRFEQDLNAALQHVDSLEIQRGREQETINAIEQQLTELESQRSIPTQEDLERSRRLRDRGWSLIRNEWKGGHQSIESHAEFLQELNRSGGLDEEVQKLIQDSDQISDRMRFDAETVALKGKLLAEKKRAERKLREFERQLIEAGNSLANVQAAWSNLWRACGIEAQSPNEMRDWLRRLEGILQLGSQLQEKQILIAELKQRSVLARNGLLEAMDAETRTQLERKPLVELARQLTEVLELNQHRAQERERLSHDLGADRSEGVALQSDVELTQNELSQLTLQWGVEMRFLGLDENTLPNQANTRIAMLDEIFEQKKEADRYRQRIDHIDRDSKLLEVELASLIRRVLPMSAESSPDEQLRSLVQRLEASRDAHKKRLTLTTQIEQATAKLNLANETIGRSQAELNEMLRHANVMAIEHLNDAAIRSYDRIKEEEKLRDAERQIAGFSNGKGIDEFIAEVETERARAQTLPARIENLNQAMKFISVERDQILGQIRSAEIELKKFDGNNEAAEKNGLVESKIASLDEQLHSLAILKMASTLLSAGIERHREKNQGPVLSRASQIFSEITLGRFSGLRADFDERGEPILMGVRANAAQDRDLVQVEGMSDGTCDQLYLALRLASLEVWLRHHEPIPFIVDDVLLNFDDERALATMEVLARLSEQTQVIFFTHHQHLVDLTENRQSLKNVFVSRLESKSSTKKLSDLLF